MYNLSEPCGPGEIDYFISHSWKDDAAQKYAQLESLAKRFQEANGRECTFWFDKVCINQRDISEDLKCLPIFVMACDRLLILYGSTYLTRLWCIWELYVFFATSVDSHRVQLQPLGTLKAEDTKQELLGFDVQRARCYMPEDEAKLRSVIRAGGEERFNDTIRGLSTLVQ